MMVKKRTKRGETGTSDKNFRFNPVGDLPILLALAEHRVLRTSHLATLTGRSQKALNGRLRKLKNAGYVGWIDPDKERFHTSNPEDLLALGDRGADLVAKHLGLRRRKVSYKELNRDIGQDSISHMLLINDFLVMVQGACLASDGEVRYIPQNEILSQIETKKDLDDPLKIKTMKGKKMLTTRPDMLFGLQFVNEQEPNKAYFFGEADRGTITQKNTKKNEKKKSGWTANYKKYEVYYHWYDNGKGDFKKDYPIENFNFRVLFYTTKDELRARNLADVVRDIHPPGKKQWMFASMQNLKDAENILKASWITGTGDSATLMD